MRIVKVGQLVTFRNSLASHVNLATKFLKHVEIVLARALATLKLFPNYLFHKILLKCFPLPIALLELEGNASIVIVVLVAGLKIKIDMPNYTIKHLIRELRQPKNC